MQIVNYRAFSHRKTLYLRGKDDKSGMYVHKKGAQLILWLKRYRLSAVFIRFFASGIGAEQGYSDSGD